MRRCTVNATDVIDEPPLLDTDAVIVAVEPLPKPLALVLGAPGTVAATDQA